MAGGPMMGGRGGPRRYKPMADINVTPMVDVMLVLLIVFMVAAPLMTSGVPVDLPKTQASNLNQEKDPITLTVNPEGQIFIGDNEVQLPDLVAKLQAITQTQDQNGAGPAAGQSGAGQPGADQQPRIFVRGDRTVNYGRVMEVMGTIAAGGFNRVALLAQQPGPAGAAAPGATKAPASAPAAAPRSPRG